MNKTLWGISIGLVIAFVAVISFNSKNATPVLGSVNYANEYHSTTTSTGRFTPLIVLATTSDFTSVTLGSIVVTGAAAGTINIYDATTSNVNLRTNQLASSTILVATVPISAAAGTYTFDVVLRTGLMVDIIGTMPTTTITYR